MRNQFYHSDIWCLIWTTNEEGNKRAKISLVGGIIEIFCYFLFTIATVYRESATATHKTVNYVRPMQTAEG